ncbi:trypsin-like peptidase domain-containing protein [Candidatus Hepatobacter penaei]|uniref:trypsin-like peptidase domain-containing protein n=1 Tax=Candidatus Hepatobacter penaei TaxID=1274402 RepID=UPI00069796E6|nr:trypsin-like peptidase domain-containing protein [Candidatus Hepatobacter penaei]
MITWIRFALIVIGLLADGWLPLAAEPSARPSHASPTKKKSRSAKKVSPPQVTNNGFADVVEPLLPAVVNVSVIKKMTTYSLEVGPKKGGGMGGPSNDLFRFRDFLDQFDAAPKKRRVPMGAGSGFIIDAEGHVVTNAHVVDGADEVIVTLADQRDIRAKVVGMDPRSDLALLRLAEKGPFPYVHFGDASQVRVGDWSIAIGNALGLGGTVTVGVISHAGRSFMMQPTHVGGFFQTDASINLGNSGGPLFNVKGEVIGINMMIASPTGGNIGIGFAIPSDVALFVIEQLKKNGYVKRGWIGVHVQDVNQDIARSLKLKKPQGALVVDVIKGAPASKAGVKPWDLITKIDNTPIKNAAQTTKVVGRLPIGKKTPVEVWRKDPKSGNYYSKILYIHIEENEEISKPVHPKQEKAEPPKGVFAYGLTLRSLDDITRKQHHIDQGTKGLLIVDVHPESRASEFFKPGDLLLSIDQKAVTSTEEAKRVLNAAQKKGQKVVLCLTQRQGIPFFAPLSLEDDTTKEKKN